MTDPLTMPAGAECDEAVAIHVMGWRRGTLHTGLWYHNALGETYAGHHVGADWRPSTDIGDAWAVVERMAALVDGNRCGAYWWNFTAGAFTDPSLASLCIRDPASVPLWICRAALAACRPGEA